jgi:multidrug efflux pump subunit AcrA (membrane-fusion protein)
MYVQPDTRLFTITDLSKVWIYAAVFQDEIGKVRPGDPATVTADAYPGANFDGRVDFIQPQIDPMTRTARVRCEFKNPKGHLSLGPDLREGAAEWSGDGRRHRRDALWAECPNRHRRG